MQDGYNRMNRVREKLRHFLSLAAHTANMYSNKADIAAPRLDIPVSRSTSDDLDTPSLPAICC